MFLVDRTFDEKESEKIYQKYNHLFSSTNTEYLNYGDHTKNPEEAEKTFMFGQNITSWTTNLSGTISIKPIK